MSIDGAPPGRDEAVQRLVETAVQLLDAARTHGDPGIIAAAKATLFLIGESLAASTEGSSEDV